MLIKNQTIRRHIGCMIHHDHIRTKSQAQLSPYNLYSDFSLLVDKPFDNNTSIKDIRLSLIGCKTKHKENEEYEK